VGEQRIAHQSGLRGKRKKAINHEEHEEHEEKRFVRSQELTIYGSE